ncbi:MAG: hypothetical protein N2316_07515 [Spirochaetes bacterium]|nr:hypothetical protein [Spirochaetota bacterium]
MLRRPMAARDFTCLYCGSKLELTLEKLAIGENRGVCPMCAEPFSLKLNREDMEGLFESEELIFK